jgi:hypothetical protein
VGECAAAWLRSHRVIASDREPTARIGRQFATVVGVDVSPAAIARARAADNPPNVSYRVLNASDRDGAAGLHGELGDANVYIRGVLQALPPGARPRGPHNSRCSSASINLLDTVSADA